MPKIKKINGIDKPHTKSIFNFPIMLESVMYLFFFINGIKERRKRDTIISFNTTNVKLNVGIMNNVLDQEINKASLNFE